MKKYIYKIVLVVSFFFITGFGGCDLLMKLFSLVNYNTNQGYNAVVQSLSYYYYATNEGKIYRHNGDDEDPWELHYTASGSPNLLDIKELFPSYFLVCVGENGTILRLEDDDEQWQVKNSNVSVRLNKILDDYLSIIYSDFIYFVVGDGGTVLRSTDDGETWTALNFPTTDNLYEISINSEDKIFVSGENYCFYSTTDDGDTWVPEGPSFENISGPFSSYNKIYFYDDNIGYVGGPNGLILKTFDGGASWGTRVASDFDEINDLFFISPDSGAAVGPNGVVRLTTDGGDNWFEDPDLTAFLNGETIKRIFPFSKNYGLVVGENGFDIFVAKDSTYLDSIKIVTDVGYDPTVVTNYLLFQNYPNPFNPNTSIQFSIPERSNVTLKVYDILGNEVTTLVNEELQRGGYEFNFDASELTSGIYFYKLQTENYVETKKMILLK